MVILLFGLVQGAQADVRLPIMFSNHMLFQREHPITVWGWSAPGEQITVKMAGQTVAVKADGAGHWRTQLAALKAGGPYELVVAGRTTITLKDVLIGDVWVCSGQSNMGVRLISVDNSAAVIAAATNSLIRTLQACGNESQTPVTNFETGPWMSCNPKEAETIMAVGYFFAKRIQEETGVPIGFISTAVNGVPIEQWLSPDSAGPWKDHPAHARPSDVSVLYNGRIAPLTASFPIKGVLWYQGESNAGELRSYYDKMRALVSGWRTAWNQGDFPFYYVQLANNLHLNPNPAGGDGWASVRMAQLKALDIPQTGMALAIDIGDPNDVHPHNKEDVGNRLALWALKNEYGRKDLVCSGPLYKTMTVEGDKVRITFDSVGSGLMVGKKAGPGPAQEVRDGQLQRFAISGTGTNWFWADAAIEGATVVVSSPKVPHPIAVRYAYSMNPEGCNLYNKEGLPASPFRTDGW